MHVGNVIHKLRKEKKITLVELAGKSGVALATLSRIENKKMTGTLESHMKIAEALELSLPDLYKDLSSPKKAVELHAGAPAPDVHKKSAASEILVSKLANKKMAPVLLRINKGGSTHKTETKPGIEKFIYVLDGKIEASIGDEIYNLAADDSLYFDPSIPHLFKNTGAGETRLLVVTCPPAL